MAVNPEYTDPIIALCQQLSPKTVLEIGIGHHAFASQAFLGHGFDVTAIDKGDWGGMGDQLSQMNPDKYHFIKGYSQDEMPKLKQKFDLIYIDGDHRYEGAKSDMEMAIPLLAKGGVILIDDYGVTEGSAVDIDDRGVVIDGAYGVKQAADEVFKDWEQVYTDIHFANGGRAYARNSR